MSYSAEVLADSPLAYYRLGESSGTTLVDSSGNGRNGTFAGGVTHGAGRLQLADTDTATDFNGTTGKATVSSPTWLNNAAITIECLYQPDVISGQRQLVDRDEASGAGGVRQWQWRITSAGKLEAILFTSAGTKTVTGGTTLTAGAKHHGAVVYDGTDIRLYLDGVLDAAPVAAAGTLTSAGTQALTIGYSWFNGGAGSSFFDGIIDEVAIYSTALSAARIAAHVAAIPGVGIDAPAVDIAIQVPAPTADPVVSAAAPAIDIGIEVPAPIVVVPLRIPAGLWTIDESQSWGFEIGVRIDARLEASDADPTGPPLVRRRSETYPPPVLVDGRPT